MGRNPLPVRKPSDRKRFWGAAGPALILAKRSQPERLRAPAFEACKSRWAGRVARDDRARPHFILAKRSQQREAIGRPHFGQTKPAGRNFYALGAWPCVASRALVEGAT